MATNELRIGALATLFGPFAAVGEDGMRGVELAMPEGEYLDIGPLTRDNRPLCN